LKLIPGMYAEVSLRVEERKGVLSVPLDAVDRSDTSTPRVFKVTQAGMLRVVAVKLGLETDQRVEIKSGLEEGDAVVTGRHAGLKDGQQVQIQMAEAAH
jgi:multidrug efflux pump subunit AcrA (membrane-fusion protein)